MSLRVYYDLMSQPCRALYLFLQKSGIKYEEKLVALRKGEHFSEEYENVNPFKLVPCMEEGDFKLNETVAMMRYLADKYPISDQWYPKDPRKRAKIDAFTHWQHLNIRFGGATTFQHLVLKPMLTGQPVNEKTLKTGQRILQSSLDLMETIFLKDTPYIYSHHLTIADLLGVCEIMQVLLIGEPIRDNRPKLSAWIDRVKEELEPEFSIAHKHLMVLGEKYLKSKKANL